MNTLKKIIDFLVIVIRLIKDCFGLRLMIMLLCTVSSSQPSTESTPFPFRCLQYPNICVVY